MVSCIAQATNVMILTKVFLYDNRNDDSEPMKNQKQQHTQKRKKKHRRFPFESKISGNQGRILKTETTVDVFAIEINVSVCAVHKKQELEKTL